MPSRIQYTAPDGQTHLEIIGFYISKETVPGTEEMANVFVRAKVGTMDGATFVPSGVIAEFRVDDPSEVTAVLNTPVSAGTLGQVLNDALAALLVSSGRVDGSVV